MTAHQTNNITNLGNIKMASFNCRSIKRSIERVRSLCREADIVCLQETWLLPHDLDYIHQIDDNFGCHAKSSVDTGAGIMRGRPYGGLAVLWRKSVFPSVSIIECSTDRLAAVRLELGNHRQLLLINVYMPTDVEDNLTEFTSNLANIMAIIDDNETETAFALRDFNAHCISRFGDELTLFCAEHSLECIDYVFLGEKSSAYTYVSDASGVTRWLDHCLGTSAAQETVTAVSIDYDVGWSDHFPLIITCNFDVIVSKVIGENTSFVNKIKWGHRNPNQISVYSNYCCNNLKNVVFSSQCVNCDNFTCTKHLYLIDKYYDEIVGILRKAAVISFDSHCDVKRKRKQVVGWNYHVNKSHKIARLCYSSWLVCGKPTNGPVYVSMVASRRIFKSKLKWCQNNQDQIKMNILAMHRENKNFPKFWQATKKLQSKPRLPHSVENTVKQKEISELFANHFKVKPINVDGLEHNTFDTFTPDEQAETLQVLPKDVYGIIRKMTRGKSPGHDNLSIEHILYAGKEVGEVLCRLFNLCIKFKYLPKNLMKTVVVPIPKNKTGDLSKLSNYRPISLGTIIGKILERLIHPLLMQNVWINDAQFGFRANVSTDSAIFSLKNTVKYYTNRDTSIYACFLDLSRAFDLVNYNLLWSKLNRHKVSPVVIKLLRYWYENQSNKVKWGDTLSNEYRLECGVRQGGLTSPDLFNIYVNGLIEELRGTKIGCHVGGVCVNNISYADDMVLLSPSIRGLRKLLNICEKYALGHGLKYNVSKTEMMVFRSGKGPNGVPPVCINGLEIRRVAAFKYLGHMLTENLADDNDIERERRALAVRCNMIARRFFRCNDDVKNSLFRAFCQNLYTCQLWFNYKKRSYSAIRVQYNDAYRILMKLPRFCSASNMFASARMPDFFAIIRSRIASFWDRLRHSSNEILRTMCEHLDDGICRHWLTQHRSANRK